MSSTWDDDEEEGEAPPHKARMHRPKAVRGVGVADDIGARPDMEDSYVFIDAFGGKPSSSFMAIYDGHGGRKCVDFVAKRLHGKLLEKLTLEVPSEEEEKAKEEREKQPAWGSLTSSFKSAFSTTNNGPPPPRYVYASEALVSAYTETDEAFRNEIRSLEGGCTAVTCLLQYEFDGDRTLYCGHVGDSRAVLCRGRKAFRLTSESDHKATDPVEMARVTQKGGMVINDRVNGMLAIARALGDFQLKRTISTQMVMKASKARQEGEEIPMVLGNVTDIVSNIPDVSSVVLNEAKDHFLILACDGVWDVISDQEAVTLVLEFLSKLTRAHIDLLKEKEDKEWPLHCGVVAQLAANALVQEALSRGSMDNVTVMIVML